MQCKTCDKQAVRGEYCASCYMKYYDAGAAQATATEATADASLGVAMAIENAVKAALDQQKSQNDFLTFAIDAKSQELKDEMTAYTERFGAQMERQVAHIQEDVERGIGEARQRINAELQRIENLKGRRVEIAFPDGSVKEISQHTHEVFPMVLKFAAMRKNVFLVGPAGSGKSTIADQIAEAFGLKSYCSAKIVDEYKLTGYLNVEGTYVTTDFRIAFEFGGVFLLDEADASAPEALIAFNMAIANGKMAFPDGVVEKHKDFIALAAGNTVGKGADRQYVGRNQLDAATLDRFIFVEMGYDEKLEVAISDPRDDREWQWVEMVQGLRHAAEVVGVLHIISPRASIDGVDMIRHQGMNINDIEYPIIWKGLEEMQINRIREEYRNAS